MLPGRLTTEHIKQAIARGDGYIEYRGTVYTITELKELDEVGRWNQGTEVQFRAGETSDRGPDQNRAGSVGKRGDKAHAKKSPAGEELIEINGSRTPE